MARSFKQRGTVVVPLAESPIPMVEVESIDNPAIFSETIAGEGNITGLTVYGKSTQDGTPSPENPIPIVSAGDGGSIALTVSDGADQSQSLTISTPTGLPGIPVDSDGNYTDAEGQQLICDEVNDSKHVHRIEQIEFDGSPDESWQMSFNENAQRNFFWIALKKMALRNSTDDNVLICSSYPYSSYGYAEPNANNTACFQSNNLNFVCTTSSFTSVEEWREYLGKNKVSLIYAVSEPIETPLSPEELAAYRALQTYDGTTVISVNSDPIAPGVKTTVKIIDPNSGNPQIMQLWLDKEGHPVNINGRGARVGGTPTQQYILQPCSF